VLGLLFLLVAAPLAAQRSLAIKGFDATITVHADGTVDVTETITAAFSGQWNGIYRTIPILYRTPQGFSWTLRLEDIKATDGDGNQLKVERSRERHYLKLKLWVPGALDATRTVTLHYRAVNGLRFFEDHDELYWNITGDEWDVPIEAVSARILLPADVTGVRAIAFDGAYGSTAQNAEVVIEGPQVGVSMPEPLGFHAGVTAVVGWDKGAVAEPTAVDHANEFLSTNWPLGIPLLVLFGMYTLWRRVGKDPEERPIGVRYDPPNGLTPAEAGTMMDESVDMRDITATIVDLAVNGHLKIEEFEKKKFLGLFSHQEFRFHRLDPKPDARPLERHETLVLDGMFKYGARTVDLSDLEDEFYTHLPGIKNATFDRLVERGLYRSRPDRVRRSWMGGALFLTVPVALIGAAIGDKFGMSPLPFALAAILSGAIVMVFGYFMPARTVSGARAYEGTRGFEEFLRRVESDRFARVVKTPEMFEKFLPYAMAFGVEAKWAKAFDDIYREPPTWYVGGDFTGFNARTFSSRISGLSTRAGSTMSSAPRSAGGSSGSSGFSGGSSGGGGGGGGGGGF
jgi:uncharacterized membrane protein YgcG